MKKDILSKNVKDIACAIIKEKEYDFYYDEKLNEWFFLFGKDYISCGSIISNIGKDNMKDFFEKIYKNQLEMYNLVKRLLDLKRDLNGYNLLLEDFDIK